MFNSKPTPWYMLFSRVTLFAAVQAVFAIGFLLTGAAHPWDRSVAWWPISVFIADAIGLILLIGVFRAEEKRFWDTFRIDRVHWKGDLLVFLGMTILIAPVSYLPNVMLGTALFGSPEATLGLFIRPLPVAAVYTTIILFPLGQGLTELVTYFGYVMPRLEAQGWNKWMAILIPGMVLGLQHIAAPLVFDVRFLLWRGLMFVPFALLTGVFYHYRPRLLPYFALVHILMNMSFATMFLSVAY